MNRSLPVRRACRLGGALLLGLPAALAAATLEWSPLFTDHAVLQRDEPVFVWGRGEPGDRVTVSLGDDAVTTEVESDGTWSARLPTREAGGPFVLQATDGDQTLVAEDILIGDVWVCSGQSNMEWELARSYRAEATLAAAYASPRIRHFKVPHLWAETPRERVEGGPWEVFSAETGADFTAVGLFFALALQDRIDVPIGLLNTSWGGSRIEPWMSAETLGLSTDAQSSVLQRQRQERERMIDQLREKIGGLPEEDRGMQGEEPAWADPKLDTSGWAELTVPALWEQEGYEGFDGVGWYRKEFELSASEAAKDATLELGMIDDSDTAWVNGVEVGGLENAYSTPRRYMIPASVLQAGTNVLAVRVVDTGGGGGIWGDDANVALQLEGERMPLAGKWRFRVGRVEQAVNLGAGINQVPTVLYNAMVAPLQRFPIKGVIWYQGESNASPDDAFVYRDLFQDLITSWREQWALGEFPFLWVQLANFDSGGDTPEISPWAILRESQSAALALPNTAQAVIIDIGAPHDIHPKNKHDVGYRLALGARHLVYGEPDLNHSGPVFQSLRQQGSELVLTFDPGGGALEVSEGGARVEGFEIAGSDGRWRTAEAVIDGPRQLRVTGSEDSTPVAVRYAWSDNPADADLVNSEGLPASPFRARLAD